MKALQDAYIVAATRAPVGKSGRGALRTTRPDDLFAQTLKHLLSQAPSLDPTAIEDVIVGCAMPEAQQGLNVARIALLLAGLPNTVGGITINRFCSSGLNAIAMAADRIRVGEADVMIAGGVESMSMVPMSGNTPSLSPDIFKDENIGIAYGMGLTAEKVAQQWKVGREAQDAFALSSHQKALAAQAAGEFSAETFAVQIAQRKMNLALGEVDVSWQSFTQDEGPRADTSLEGLAKLRAVFAAKGSVTAGNSSQTSDGAGALLIVSEKALKQFNLTPLARFVSFAIKGVAPEIMGIGPKEAIPAALRLAGLKQDAIDWIELNEAFAAQACAVNKELGIDPLKVNVNGGAIAIGHPIGASGCRILVSLLHEMQRRDAKKGLAALCIGGGMGVSLALER